MSQMINWFLPYVTRFLFIRNDIYWWIQNIQLYLIKCFCLSSYFLPKNIREVLYKHMYKKQNIGFSFFMLTITSYFGFLLAALTVTSVLFIGLSKIRLIWLEMDNWKFFDILEVLIVSISNSWSLGFMVNTD